MTTTQAAKLIGCDPSSVRRMVRSNLIKGKKVAYPDGTFAYDISEKEVERVKKLPKIETRGYPRGRARKA